VGRVLPTSPEETGVFELSEVVGLGLVPELEEHLPRSVKSRSTVFAVEQELDAHGEGFLLVLEK